MASNRIVPLSRIRSLVRSGLLFISARIQEKVSERDITYDDVEHAILNAKVCKNLTDDPTHIRYCMTSQNRDEAVIEVVVCLDDDENNVVLKSAYWLY